MCYIIRCINTCAVRKCLHCAAWVLASVVCVVARCVYIFTSQRTRRASRRKQLQNNSAYILLFSLLFNYSWIILSLSLFLVLFLSDVLDNFLFYPAKNGLVLLKKNLPRGNLPRHHTHVCVSEGVVLTNCPLRKRVLLLCTTSLFFLLVFKRFKNSFEHDFEKLQILSWKCKNFKKSKLIKFKN